MQIIPMRELKNTTEVERRCAEENGPVYVTKNGYGRLVVMDIETYNRREKMLKLREELLSVEEDRMAGRTGTTVDELDAYLDGIIEEV
mgnify:CR=1 FL=1